MLVFFYIYPLFFFPCLAHDNIVNFYQLEARIFKRKNAFRQRVVGLWDCESQLLLIFFPFLSHFSVCLRLSFVRVFSGTRQAKTFRLGIHMINKLFYHGIETWVHIALVLPLFIHFSFFFILHILEIMQFNMHMDNELLYCGDDNQAHYSFPSYICPFFFLFVFHTLKFFFTHSNT